jgi:amino acid transporter
MVVWYNVSGGPFGVEESVRSAGFFVSILGFLIMPFVWSLPEALMTAELGSTYPEAAGGVAWVEEAFGSAAGWQAGYLGWVAGATDNAIYPVLFLDYVMQLGFSAQMHEVHPGIRFFLLSSTTILLGYLNWRGLHIVGNMSIVIGVLSMAPFVVMVLIGIFKIDPSRWLEIPEQVPDADGAEAQSQEPQGLLSALLSSAILWRPLFNCLFWNLNSYDATASYAAEVRDPGHVLPRALMWGWVLMMAGYLLPLMVAIGATDSEPADWVDGYLTTAAEEIGGEWLGAWLVFAAGVSNIAQFEAELSADAFQLMGMAERGFVPKFFATRSRHGTPTFGIILGVVVIILMGSFNFEELIEMLNFNYSISLLLEYSAFIKLRISKPDGMFCFGLRAEHIHHVVSHLLFSCFLLLVPRPFRIPLGTVGSCIFLSFPVMAIFLIIAIASKSLPKNSISELSFCNNINCF